MTIGAAWNIDDPTKPWALFDSDAKIPIPIGLDDWLADLGAAYGSHTILTAAPLECVSAGTYSAGTILVRMKLVTSPVYTDGVKYPFTVRVVGADGFTQDDRTLWLKVKSR
jgi:hypothetical protein